MTEFADAAPEAVIDQTAPEAPSQVATEMPAAEPAETPAPTVEDSLKAVWDKHNPPRDPVTKRFVPRAAQSGETLEGQPEESLQDQPETEEAKPETPAIQPPMSWSGEMKAKWAVLPPDVQTYVAQRDKETHDAISRAGQHIKTYEPIGQVINQFAETFQRNNLHPAEGIARLLAVEERLAKDPQQTLLDVARAYGVDLQALASGQGEATGQQLENPDVASVRAQLAETQTQLRQVTSYLTAQQHQQISADRDVLARQIADFADAKDTGGKLRHPHLDQVSGTMAALMNSDPNLDLEQAYERAVYADPTIRSGLLEQGRKAEEIKRQEDAKKKAFSAKNAAALNVQSSPASGSSPKSWEDTLRETAVKHYGR